MTSLLSQDATATLPTRSWHDWSCLVRLVVTDPAALTPATEQLRGLMRRVDLAASRFRPESELSRVNARAGRPVAVSPLLVRLVRGALAARDATGGAVDPLLGRRLAELGYDRDITELVPVGPPGAYRRVGELRLDPVRGLLTVPAGAGLDLGATAKAQTADWAAAEIAARFGCSALVELGGDLAVAGGKADWQVLVAERAGDAGQQITLDAGGLATSTTVLRRWPSGGRELHHLLDPATGQPADGPWRTVTVAAASALRANAASTAAIVLGSAAEGWLAEQRLAARLVGADGAVRTVGGWPC